MVPHPVVAAGPTASGEDRVLTLPNAITAVRLLCVPLFLWLLLGQERRAAAAYLLAFIGATDWVDGYLARHLHQVSTLGKVLDPVADRVVLLTGVVGILIDGSAPLWLGVVTLVREVLISTGTLVVAALAKQSRRIDVSWWGKAGTFCLFFAYPMFLASHADLGSPTTWRALAWTCALPGLLCGWLALAMYVPQAARALRSPGAAPEPARTEETP